MAEQLPEFIEPLVLADKQVVLTGDLPVSRLERLSDLLYANAGAIKVSLAFGKDGRQVRIDGSVKGVLTLQCQRCLQPVKWTVDCGIRLAVVASIDQANRLADGYEPLLLESEGKILLKDMIEDEMLLSLPDFPKHDYDCFNQVQAGFDNRQRSAADGSSDRDSPFAILAKLKNTGDF